MATIRQMLEEVDGSTTRIAQMVKAVKAYSYVDTTSLRSADLHEALENSLTILGHKLRDARVTVESEYDRTLPLIQTYGTELGQVWTNLLDNAVDAVAHSPSADAANAGRITIRTAGDDAHVRVEITDSGAGIPQEIIPKIFDPFFTTKEAGKGTGLGLEIVKRIVSRHSGTIDVESVPGATRFTVSLPITQAGRDGAETVADGATSEHPAAGGARGEVAPRS
jgi:signal transduction histidine kinase